MAATNKGTGTVKITMPDAPNPVLDNSTFNTLCSGDTGYVSQNVTIEFSADFKKDASNATTGWFELTFEYHIPNAEN